MMLLRYTGDTPLRIPEDPALPAEVEIARPVEGGTPIAVADEGRRAMLLERDDFELVEELSGPADD